MDSAPPRRPRALALIIAYKLGKGALWWVLASSLVLVSRRGLDGSLVHFAERLREHARAWSLTLAEWILRTQNPRVLRTLIAALFADGTMTLLEGWALIHGSAWGPWVVVVSSGSLLPFEVVALSRRLSVGRATVLLVNAAIVAYLARKAIRELRARGARPRDGSPAARDEAPDGRRPATRGGRGRADPRA